MNKTRKKIIINEILYWKKARLLPEQYCDYLLALYSEGEEIEVKTRDGKNTFLRMLPYLAIAIIVIGAICLTNFTQLPFKMQIAISAAAALLLLLFVYLFSSRKPLMQVSLIGASLMILAATVDSVEGFAPKNNTVLYSSLLANCLVWWGFGRKLSLLYFTIAGILGTVVICFFLARIAFKF
ncbi:hypothetical protein D0469_00920 [Peribacillus saganii]|uniref:DUF2157 domain-containing protein n=1 Tax=Peribacillus saganii TaxID=2303992 RepID=A0A372LV57_9BACI|nr:hypothetical protein [Peribacillus saganii]RFU71702.1 hypothetical protein D0469_00920 [Peribacillus saganii]